MLRNHVDPNGVRDRRDCLDGRTPASCRSRLPTHDHCRSELGATRHLLALVLVASLAVSVAGHGDRGRRTAQPGRRRVAMQLTSAEQAHLDRLNDWRAATGPEPAPDRSGDRRSRPREWAAIHGGTPHDRPQPVARAADCRAASTQLHCVGRERRLRRPAARARCSTPSCAPAGTPPTWPAPTSTGSGSASSPTARATPGSPSGSSAAAAPTTPPPAAANDEPGPADVVRRQPLPRLPVPHAHIGRDRVPRRPPRATASRGPSVIAAVRRLRRVDRRH